MGSRPLRVRVLGGFAVSVGDVPVPESAWRLRKAKSLVKLLALADERRLHREQAAELLWPEREVSSAANNLHQALYVARRALEAAGADATACLTLRDGMLVLCEERPVEVDLDAFEAAAAQAQAMRTPEAVRAALASYGGELLPEDRYEGWTTTRRQELREQHLALLLELADLHAAAGESSAAVAALERAVVDDPFHEDAHRRLMRLFAAGGRRQQALAQYHQLREMLRREYEADPDEETRRLYQEILTGGVDIAEPSDSPTAPARAPGSRRDTHDAPQAHPNNLPLQLTSFVGRKRELAEVQRLLHRTRLLTLTGPGGCGKTRLALELAGGRLREFEDGVWVIELASLSDPGLVPHETAAVLGMHLRSDRDPADALAALLGERRLLLVLDNCEHLVTACAGFAEQLLRACPRLEVLATSREPLRVGGEVAWRVPSLALPDPAGDLAAETLLRYEAVRLFCERAADVAAAFRLTEETAPAVAEVCFRLDGMPLAIELAAARSGVLSPSQIAERLRDSLSVLGGGRGGLTRQQTLSATLAWSHDLLTDSERVLFRRLAVFAGSFGLDAVEGVCDGDGIEADEVLDLLGRLVDKSLVVAEEERGEYRYRLLETIRQYAHERCLEAGETARGEARHRHWYLRVAEAADPLTAGDRFFERPELELDNLRAALATALHADPPLALRIAEALFQFWITRGYFTEAARLLDAALAAAPQRTPLRAGALEVAAALEVRRARRDFVRLVQESAGIHEELGDRRALAATLLHIGSLEWVRSDHAAAQARLAEALALAEEVGDAAVAAAACHVQGIDAHSRGDDPEARRWIAESLDRLAGFRDETAPAMWAMTIGLAYDDDGRGQPRAYFEDTWLMYRRIGPEAAEGYVLCSLAAVARSQRDYDSARGSLDRSLALFRELDDGFGTGVALNALGNLARSRDQIELGREWLEEALVVRQALGDRRSTAMTLGNLGLLEGRAGDVERGREHLGRALAILRETEDVAGMGAETINLAYLELGAGEPDRARPLLERGERLFGGRHSQHLVAWARAALAEILMRSPGLSAEGPHEAAREALERARLLFSEIEDVRGLAHVQALEAELLGAASAETAG